MKKYILLLTLLACTAISSLAQAPDANGILYVKKGSTGTGNSWANALGELADALKAATTLNGATAGTVTQIWVAAGTYLPLYPADAVTTGAATTTNRNNAFVLVKDVQLYGGFAGTETALSGRDSTRVTNTTILSGNLGVATDSTDNAYHVVIAANAVGTAAINSFVITRGVANFFSNIISVNGASIQGGVGGGMATIGLSTTVLCSPAIANITLTVNFAEWMGGGMCNNFGSPAISNTIISNNVTRGYGGGMTNYNAAPDVNNVVISGNLSSSYGGGITNVGSLNPHFTNVRISGNQAQSGGGIYNVDYGSVNPVLINVTITGNFAFNGVGDAIYNEGSARSTISNSIIYGNSSGLNFIPAAGTLTYSLVQGVAANAADHVLDGTTINPLFNNPSTATAAPFAGGDYSLKATSPVINAGSNSLFTGLSTVTKDLAGNARVTEYGNDGIIDLGAYEYPVPVLRPDANGILYVKKGSAGGGNNWANALGELADALKAATTLNSATAGTVKQIWVAAGTYLPRYPANAVTTGIATTTDRTNAFVLVKDVKIYGGFAGTETMLTSRDSSRTTNQTILSGNLGDAAVTTDNALRVVIAAGLVGAAEMNSFIVRDGNGIGGASITVNGIVIGAGIGAGIVCYGSVSSLASPVIANITSTANTNASAGGGLYNNCAAPVVNNVIISENSATSAGGIFNGPYASPILHNVLVSGNSANNGGGMGINTATAFPVLVNVTFRGNVASSSGGGVYNSNVSTSFTNVTFRGNIAGLNGGGVYNTNASPSFTNVLMSGNKAANGGAMYNSAASEPILTNVTVAGNLATTNGGGLYYFNTSPILYNCIIYGNSAGTATYAGVYPSITPATTCEYNLVQGASANATYHILSGSTVDPAFIGASTATAPFTDGDYSLQGSSPAKNAGNDALYTAISGYPTKDLAGLDRFTGTIDLGAYEAPLFQPQTITMLADTAVIYGAVFTRAFAASSGLTVTLSSADNSIAEVYQDAGDNNIWKIKTKKAGSVVITMSQAGDANYAAAADVTFTLTVNQANLTVTANDSLITYTGVAFNGGNGVTYSGFVNGDDSTSALTGTLTYSGTSQGASSIDTYVITPGGLAATNYTISYTNGSLTIGLATNANGVVFVKKGSAGSGSSWANAIGEVATALKAAGVANGVTAGTVKQIWVAKGTYLPMYPANNVTGGTATTTDQTNSFVLLKDVKMYGGFAGTETDTAARDFTNTANTSILSGDLGISGDNSDNAYHVLLVAGNMGSAVISGFTVTGGNANTTSGTTSVNGYSFGKGYGGGISIGGTTALLMEDMTFSNNTAYYGGAISANGLNANNEAMVGFRRVNILNNTSLDLGGAMYLAFSTVDIDSANVRFNTCAGNYGGGMFVSSASYVTGTRLHVNDNNATGSSAVGGGIFVSNSAVVNMTNSELLRDTAIASGALLYENSTAAQVFKNVKMSGGYGGSTGAVIYCNPNTNLTFINTLITGNKGLAVYIASGTLNFINTTISGNGTGIYPFSGIVNIENSIIYGNTTAGIQSGGATVTSKYSTIEGATDDATNHITSANPLFNNPSAATAPFTDGDYSLKATSPVINAGSNSLFTGLSAVTKDLAGNPRVTDYSSGGVIDMGAYESLVPTVQPDANGILYVKKGVAGTGVGNNWANALGELADALKAAQTLAAGTVTQIWVAGGTYYPVYAADFSSPDNRDKAFVLVNNVKVYGGFAGTETSLTDRDLTLTGNKSILNGDLGTLNTATDNVYHVVVMAGTAGTAELNGFTVTGGYANRSGNLIVNGIAVTGSYGGGMQLSSASPVLANMEFLANTADRGGALALYSGVSATIQNTVFKTNTATSGGAVYINSNNTSVFDRVTFSGNNASANGGAISITLNAAPVFKNVQITGNKAGGNGGAAFISNNTGYQVSFINSVLSGNSSANGVIYTQAASIVLQNSIVYGNSHSVVSTGGSAPNNFDYSLVQEVPAIPASHIMDGATDPLFVSPRSYSNAPFTDGNYALQYFSPVINKGSNALYVGVAANTTDLAGNARVYQYAQSGAVDMGAYEYQGLAGQTITAADMVKTIGAADFEPGATASSGLTVNYASADNSIAEAYQDAADSNKWKIRIKKAGKVNITASQPGDAYTDAATDTLFALTILGPDANGIIYVKKGATGAGNSWANAVGELADALRTATILNAATAGTVKQIWVAKGTYLPAYPANAVTTGTATNTDRNNSFVLVKDTKLYGGFAGNETDITGRNFITNTTILSGDIGTVGARTDNAYRVVVAAGEMGDALISGFTISGGYCQVSGNVAINGVNSNIEYGAGITVRSATLLIEDVILSNNYDNNGAGAACYAGSGDVMANATFRRVNFLRNSALVAGAGMYVSYANVLVENSTGSFNVASGGASSAGGMFSCAQSATLNCRQSSFNDNKALFYGGAVLCSNDAVATFYTCEFLRDTCGQTGGAFYTSASANMLFENCAIKGCVSGTYVAVAYVNGSTSKVTFINSQVTGNYNTSSSDFGIIRVGGGTLNIINTTIGGNNKSAIINAGSTVNVFNSIIYGNGGGITGSYSALYSTIQGSAADPATHITNADPLFVSSNAFAAAPFTGGDYSVQSISPVINAGYDSIYHANDTTATDLAGNSRFMGGAIDQGAYEVQLASQTITVLADTAVVYGAVFARTFAASSGLTVALASADNSVAEVYQDAADGNAWKIKAKKVGTVNIAISQAGDANYAPATDVVFALTVDKAPLSITAKDTGFIYTGITYNGGNGIVYSGFVNGDDSTSALTGGLTYSGTSQGAVNANTYVITPGGLAASNYDIIYAGGALTIDKAALTVTASAATKTYDGLAYSGGNGVTYSGFVNNEDSAAALTGNVTYAGTSQGAKNVNAYVITPGGLAAINYALTYANGTLTIGNAGLTITASAATKTYDGLAYSGGNGVTYNGFVNSETAATAVTGTVTYSGTSQNAKNVNTYVITPGGLAAANYALTYADGSLTIGKAALTVTASDATKTYDGLGYSGGNGVTYSGFVNNEDSAAALTGTVTYSGSSQGAKNVNAYVITPGGVAAANYSLTYGNGTLTISKAALTVTASAATKTYDGLVYSGGNGVTYSGFVNNEDSAAALTGTVTYSGSSQGAKNVNAYVITPGGLAAANYSLTYADGILTIGRAALTVTASAATKTYDGLAYSGGNGVTYSGFVNSETAATAVTGTVTYAGSSQGAKNVNTYVITPGGLAAINYALTYADGTLTIGKAALTVTASAATKTYDGLAYSGGNGVAYSGFVNSETAATAVTGTVTYTGTSQGAKNVNTYVITPGGLTAANYSLTYGDGTLTIGKAALTVTASDATKTYDGLGYSGGNGVTYSGFVNSETAATAVTGTVTYAGTSQGAKNVNTYVITPGGLSASNYTITYTDGTLTIGKAALTVTASDATKTYDGLVYSGGNGVTYSGFVNSETAATAVTGTVTYAGTSQGAKNVNTYVITPGGLSAANYTLTYADGTLTIGKAALTVTASAATKTYDGLGYSGGNGVTYSGFVNSETAATAVTGTVTYSGTSQGAKNVNTYVITPGGLAAANYTLTYADGTLTIGKAALTITASAATKTYDGLAYSGGNGVAYSGFVNSETAATAVTGTVTYGGTSQGAKNVNTYVITPGGLAAVNYALTYADGTLTIGKAALTVTASAAAKTYDGVAYSGGNGVTYSGFVNSETAATAVTGTVTYSGSSQGAKNVNTYVITPGGLSAANYTITYANGTLTIGKAALTITASAATKTYDGLAYSGGNGVMYSGFVNSETAATAVTGTVTYTGTSQGAKNVNTYVITPGGLSAANYTLTYANGTLTIGKAALTIAAENKLRCYGFANPVFTYTYTGFVNGETAAVLNTMPTAVTAATVSSVAGPYSIVPSGAAGANYAIAYNNGTLTVQALPVSTLSAAQGTILCGTTASLTLDASGAYSFAWRLNNVVLPGQVTGLLPVTAKGTYTAVATDVYGCTAPAVNSIAITQLLPPQAAFSFDSYCAGKQVNFTNQSTAAESGPVNYTWNSGNGTSSTAYAPQFTYNTAGNYMVTLTVTPQVCPSLAVTASKTIAVEAALPGVKLPGVLVPSDEPTVIRGRSLATASYAWLPATGLSNTSIYNPLTTLQQDQAYTIQMIFPSGCITTDSLQASVFVSSVILAANVFSPNGDGQNDQLVVNLRGVKQLTFFRVFNRAGKKLFETSDPAKGWDGRYNGELQPLATYIWTAEGVGNHGNTIRGEGSFTLLR
jgi:gliding motility-associated-like protein